MTNDVKEACERLRVIKAGAPRPGYGHPYEYQHMAGGWFVNRSKIAADQLLLVDAYLAENDETEITEEWLRSVGFQDDDEWPYLRINSGWEKPPGFDLEAWNDGDWTVSDADNTLKLIPPKTRGDVIRLCIALGIPLKPAGSGEGGQ